MNYAVPIILHRAGMLQTFYTDYYCPKLIRNLIQGAWPNVLNRFGSVKRLTERFHPGLPDDKVKYYSRLAFSYYFRSKNAGSDLKKRNHIALQTADAFARWILSNGFRVPDIIYTFFGEGLLLTTAPQVAEVLKVTEVPISPLTWRLLMQEIKLWPDWSYPGQLDFMEEAEPWAWERGRRHLTASDLVISPSNFVRDGVREMGINPAKVVVIPYGVNTVSPLSLGSVDKLRHKNTKILFVGTLEIRKGVQYLYEAIKLLKNSKIEVHLVGGSNLPLAAQKILQRHCRLWGHVPRSEVVSHLRQADLFVFPSIAEGSATVCYEALAAGLPVITTPNAGSVVRDGTDGFIVPIRDSQALAEKIDRLASDVKLRKEMGMNARERAKEFTVECYGERLKGAILARWTSKHGRSFDI